MGVANTLYCVSLLKNTVSQLTVAGGNTLADKVWISNRLIGILLSEQAELIKKQSRQSS
jgi:hypothetical protein